VEKMEIHQIEMLAMKFWGGKLKRMGVSREKQECTIILYDAYIFGFSIDERYKSFHAVLCLQERVVLHTLLGKNLSINNDEKSILETFSRIDQYCRLRLPKEYVQVFDNM